jgi:hypothetical protein
MAKRPFREHPIIEAIEQVRGKRHAKVLVVAPSYQIAVTNIDWLRIPVVKAWYGPMTRSVGRHGIKFKDELEVLPFSAESEPHALRGFCGAVALVGIGVERFPEEMQTELGAMVRQGMVDWSIYVSLGFDHDFFPVGG